MATYNLDVYDLNHLRKMAIELNIKPRRSKSSMIEDISRQFDIYTEYKKQKLDRYTRIKRIGTKGKEGITYEVKDCVTGNIYAMKTFKKTKSPVTLKTEYKLQKRAARLGVSPKPHDYDEVSKYIVMDKLDSHLLHYLNDHKGQLYKYQQKRIIEIFKRLDEAKVFHGDANLTNYMMKDKEIYIIDFGFAKEINDRLLKKLNTQTPNLEYMTLGFVLKLKDFNCPVTSYKYFLKFISDENKAKFGLLATGNSKG